MKKLWSWITWQRVPVSAMEIRDPRQEAATATLYAVFFVLVAVGIGLMIRDHPVPVLGAASFLDDFWYIVVFKLFFLLTVPLVWFLRKGYRIRGLMPGWKADTRHILTLGICLVVGMSANLLQGRLGMVREAAAGYSGGELTVRMGLGLLVPLAQAGFPEEFVFRGILQTRLERVWGRHPAHPDLLPGRELLTTVHPMDDRAGTRHDAGQPSSEMKSHVSLAARTHGHQESPHPMNVGSRSVAV